jgi:outer membrane murein-binding lipoprotein Lpp
VADITDERLREIASSDPLVLAICAKMGEPSWADVRAIADELLAARAEVERLQGIIDDIEVESGHCHFLNDEEHEPPHLPDHVRAIVQERDAARAQLQADDQRAWEALGKPEGTYSTTNVQRLCAEVERLRADMREAVELLGAFNFTIAPGTLGLHERRTALLAKHKEPNQ